MSTLKFEGWCSVDEYEKWSREVDEHDQQITAQIMRQIEARRRMKAMETVKQYARVGLWLFERFTIGAIAIGLLWFCWQVVEALPRFIEAWR